MNAFKHSQRQLNIKSIVFYATCALLCLAACALSFRLNITNAIALEQEIRCGITEHTHTDSCYSEDFLVCKRASHTHDGNCYIVLLKENNINGILTLLGKNKNRSLEYVITDTMSSALHFNSNINSAESSGSASALTLTQDTVAQLNDTISDEDTLPDIVLNEGINTPQKLASDESSQQTQPSGNSLSLFAIGDNPVTSGMVGNLYIYLDNEWTFIGTVPITRSGSGSNRSVHVATDALLETVNGALDSAYTYQSFDLSSSRYLSYSYTRYTLGEAQTTIATGQSNSNSQKVRYIRLIKKAPPMQEIRNSPLTPFNYAMRTQAKLRRSFSQERRLLFRRGNSYGKGTAPAITPATRSPSQKPPLSRPYRFTPSPTSILTAAQRKKRWPRVTKLHSPPATMIGNWGRIFMREAAR